MNDPCYDKHISVVLIHWRSGKPHIPVTGFTVELWFYDKTPTLGFFLLVNQELISYGI